jgi:hypothetical protein
MVKYTFASIYTSSTVNTINKDYEVVLDADFKTALT